MKILIRSVQLFFMVMFITSFLNAQTYEWAKTLGATSCEGVAADASGNSYLVGTFSSFLNTGQMQLLSRGSADVFVAKYDPLGNLLWAQQIGSTGTDYGYGIAVDAAGNSYVTGYILGSALFGSVEITGHGSYDIFIAKYDSVGNLKWAKTAGGQSDDWGRGIALDKQGNVYVVGNYQQSAFFGQRQLTSSGDRDVVLAKYNSSGECVWAGSGGGPGIDEGRGVGVDAQGNSYITGYFQSRATFGPDALSSQGAREIFVAKFDSTGKCIWGRQAQGSFYNMGYALASDAQGNSVITGYISSATAFGQQVIGSNEFTTAFLARFDASGSCQWAQTATGTGYVTGNGVAAGNDGTIYLIGRGYGTFSFGETGKPVRSTSAAAYVAKFDQAGVCQWLSGPNGGDGNTDGKSVALNPKGKLWMTGTSSGTSMFGDVYAITNGVFVAKFSSLLLEVDDTGKWNPALPRTTMLEQNYPNPFNPSTVIGFVLAERSQVSLKVYDVAGRALCTIVEGEFSAGRQEVRFDGSALPSGVYFYTLNARPNTMNSQSVFCETKRFILMK